MRKLTREREKGKIIKTKKPVENLTELIGTYNLIIQLLSGQQNNLLPLHQQKAP